MNNKGVFRLRDMIGSMGHETQMVDGRYVRGVPEPFWYGLFPRLRAAREIIAGRAYAVEWPKPGEIEAAMKADSR